MRLPALQVVAKELQDLGCFSKTVSDTLDSTVDVGAETGRLCESNLSVSGDGSASAGGGSRPTPPTV